MIVTHISLHDILSSMGSPVARVYAIDGELQDYETYPFSGVWVNADGKHREHKNTAYPVARGKVIFAIDNMILEERSKGDKNVFGVSVGDLLLVPGRALLVSSPSYYPRFDRQIPASSVRLYLGFMQQQRYAHQHFVVWENISMQERYFKILTEKVSSWQERFMLVHTSELAIRGEDDSYTH